MTDESATNGVPHAPVRIVLRDLQACGVANVEVEAETVEDAERLLATILSRVGMVKPPVEVAKLPASSEQTEVISLVRRRMFELGVNQDRLAELAGVSPSSISTFLRGKTRLNPEAQAKVFEGLGIEQSADS